MALTPTTPPLDGPFVPYAPPLPVVRPKRRSDVGTSTQDAEPLDPIAALAALAGDLPALSGNGLADELLAWLAPQPRGIERLSQSAVVPLLGAAAELLTRADQTDSQIVGLGATALAQELRAHRALADRRATLINP